MVSLRDGLKIYVMAICRDDHWSSVMFRTTLYVLRTLNGRLYIFIPPKIFFNPSANADTTITHYELRIMYYELNKADIIRPVNYLFFLRTRTATTSGPILEATAAPIEPNISAFLPVRLISSFSTSFARVLSRP